MKNIFVSGSFDNLHSRHIRMLEEASKLGTVTVCLWSDSTVAKIEGKAPKFPLDERLYILNAVRHAGRVEVCNGADGNADMLPRIAGIQPDVWVVDEKSNNQAKRSYCDACGLDYVVITDATLQKIPDWHPVERNGVSASKKVIVTGCFDWLHSGHVRFFEEVSELGELYVGVGHDANIRLLKGELHPLFPEAERRYMVQAIRFVREAHITSGHGWMDAEPEIQRLGIDVYAVNEDGDKPEKRAFCAAHGLEYVVRRRDPAPGLPRRQSTDLRGF
ncbi:MAG: adenylyltransferase/cytidyltransferase family protein [Anaerolineales bacterium]